MCALAMEAGVVLAGLLLLIVLLIMTRLVLGPMKMLGRLMVHCGAGFLVLAALNAVGSVFGFQLPLNPVSVVGVGMLGAPGVALLSVLNFLLS
jgi:inhibitor of the pro-sigma K processing machinery